MMQAVELHPDVHAAPTVQAGVSALLLGIIGQLRDRHSDPDQVLIYCRRLEQAVDDLAEAVAHVPAEKPAKPPRVKGAKPEPKTESGDDAQGGAEADAK